MVNPQWTQAVQSWRSYNVLSHHRSPFCLMKFINISLCAMNRTVYNSTPYSCSFSASIQCQPDAIVLYKLISTCKCRRKRQHLSKLYYDPVSNIVGDCMARANCFERYFSETRKCGCPIFFFLHSRYVTLALPSICWNSGIAECSGKAK